MGTIKQIYALGKHSEHIKIHKVKKLETKVTLHNSDSSKKKHTSWAFITMRLTLYVTG